MFDVDYEVNRNNTPQAYNIRIYVHSKSSSTLNYSLTGDNAMRCSVEKTHHHTTEKCFLYAFNGYLRCWLYAYPLEVKMAIRRRHPLFLYDTYARWHHPLRR
ncbi:hypothetical protein EYW98_14095 [Escherichia coli]|uniref:delta endotoxin C-terminal domain-containing protein n=1 Tax=Escherichia sp. MOD1-EC7003 TaxID=2093900 RepID=UPI000F0BD0CB|nr:hypothetical protein [Escherichia coli]EGO8377996.1 hypothetical protein [Escherichia coli]MCH0695463.1 hypothetical protein [Escherichia coli]